MKRPEQQARFSILSVVVVIATAAILVTAGLFVYQHSRTKVTNAASSSQATNNQQAATTTSPGPTVSYLDIKEWGIKIPLSSNIHDAYYVIPQSISYNSDGKPSGVYVDVKSLNASCGDATAGNTNRSIENAVGEIGRSLPTDTDPVSGKPYTQLNPDGITIGGYYYGYINATNGKTCASQSLLQSVDAAFANATKSAVSDTVSTN